MNENILLEKPASFSTNTSNKAKIKFFHKSLLLSAISTAILFGPSAQKLVAGGKIEPKIDFSIPVLQENKAKINLYMEEIKTWKYSDLVMDVLNQKDIKVMFEKEPEKTIQYIKDIIDADKEYASHTLKSLGEENVAQLFAKKPYLFVQIAEETEGGSSNEFKALAQKDISDYLMNNESRLMDSFLDIINETGKRSYSTAYQLSQDSVAKLFVINPELFAKIADATEYADYAFYALLQKDINEFYARSPQLVADLFCTLAEDVSEDRHSSAYAFYALSKDDVAKLFVKNPSLFISMAEEHREKVLRVFKALSVGGVADMYEQDSEAFELIALRTYEPEKVFKELKDESVRKLYFANPSAFSKILYCSKGEMDEVAAVFKHPKIGELFLKHTSEFVQLALNTHYLNVDLVFETLTNPIICRMFEKDPNFIVQKYKQLYEAGAIYRWMDPLHEKYHEEMTSELMLLKLDIIASFFEKEPERLINCMCNIRKNGSSSLIFYSISSNAYRRGGNLQNLFVQYPEKFVKLAEACDDELLMLDLLTSGKISEFFINKTDEAVKTMVEIAEISDKYRPFMGSYDAAGRTYEYTIERMLGSGMCSSLYVQKPYEFIKILRVIKGDAYFGMSALDQDDISKMFLSDPQSVIERFDQFKDATDGVSGQAFKALAKDSVAKWFCKDPDQVIKIFEALADEAEGDGFYLFNAISEEKILAKCRSDPQFIISHFNTLSKEGGSYSDNAFFALETPLIHAEFFRNPTEIVNHLAKISDAAGKSAHYAFYEIQRDEKTAGFFVKNLSIFSQLAEHFEEGTAQAFGTVFVRKVMPVVEAYANKNISFEELVKTISENLLERSGERWYDSKDWR
ncbi:MAG: hypothetical protein ABIH83_00410 [Candidatus Micrarchaeota archaeon]